MKIILLKCPLTKVLFVWAQHEMQCLEFEKCHFRAFKVFAFNSMDVARLEWA